MSKPKRKNKLISICDGVVVVDVSTPMYQDKFMTIDFDDYVDILLDGTTSRAFCEYHSKSFRVSVHIDGKKVLMHRQIISGNMIDHIDRNPLNNCRSNLRSCTPQQNNFNTGVSDKSKSGYKGVSWSTQMSSWRAMIRIDGKRRHIGYYKSAKDASIAYNDIANVVHGDFFYMN